MERCEWLPNRRHFSLSHKLSHCNWLLCDAVNDAREALHQPHLEWVECRLTVFMGVSNFQVLLMGTKSSCTCEHIMEIL